MHMYYLYILVYTYSYFMSQWKLFTNQIIRIVFSIFFMQGVCSVFVLVYVYYLPGRLLYNIIIIYSSLPEPDLAAFWLTYIYSCGVNCEYLPGGNEIKLIQLLKYLVIRNIGCNHLYTIWKRNYFCYV